MCNLEKINSAYSESQIKRKKDDMTCKSCELFKPRLKKMDTAMPSIEKMINKII